ncbi:hypothetical protein [Neisseria sp. Ec49-e6-T10]|uniref:hypothetical protein n=1 Tax=Neisseria sp. Ec49-e6-T10 TaxID=3140744 RepID=UPI003EBAA550
MKKTVSLEQIIYNAKVMAMNGETLESLASQAHNSLRFPVAVKPETHIFLESQAETLGISISALSGIILNGLVHHEFLISNDTKIEPDAK